jgi:hypothetical protein
MRRVTVAAVLVLSSCSSPSAIQPGRSPSAPPAARDRMSSVRSYVVYYGAGRLDDLARFDLAIIDPSTLTPTEVGELEARGTLVVGYLSVGEISPNDPWITDGTVPRSWIPGRNRNWGSGKLLDYGFDGVFLDTVDTATDVEPTSVPGMISLIEGLRTAYPDALLVQNRGFDIAEQVAGSIDAVMFEDLSTSYDFDNLTYLRVDNSDEADRMVELRERTGLPILSLDYAPPEDHATAARAVRIARGYGFVPAVSTIELDDIPDYGLGRAS